MIYLHSNQADMELIRLVKLGFIRSFTSAQVHDFSVRQAGSSVHVFVNPEDTDLVVIQTIAASPAKIIILGKLRSNLAELLGMTVDLLPEEARLWDQCAAAPVYGVSESRARIRYNNLPAGLECQITDRPLLRYDFAAEWNNLGYGHVRTDASIWSLACMAKRISASEGRLASVYQDDEELTIYANISTLGQTKILWINRPVGLVDTHEFRLIETFVTNYKCDDLPCLPMIREIPYGYDAMISMRLDCDEDVSSARQLFELYKSKEVPLSLAVRTGQPFDDEDVELINDIVDNDGGILSHSVNHKCNWGDDFDDVKTEAEKSREDILHLTDRVSGIYYAVSPFHQNPDYAVNALDATGYKGFVSGIICNDPQYLISRGGRVCDSLDIISHSQQCMLHGDCIPYSADDSLQVFKQCARYAIDSGAVFGYLDHPFSERYQYGWHSEEQRVSVHRDWIDYLKTFGEVIFIDEIKLLEHIRKKSETKIWLDDSTVKVEIECDITGYALAYEFKGFIHEVR